VFVRNLLQTLVILQNMHIITLVKDLTLIYFLLQHARCYLIGVFVVAV